LLELAQDRREQRARLAVKEREREREKAERAAAAARQRRLDVLAREGDRAWLRVTAHINSKKPTEYDAAVALLCDLRDLSDRGGHREVFTGKLLELTQIYASRPALLERLNRADLKAT
jgi:hypothetical protein